MTFMVKFLLRKIFRENLNEAISLAKIDVTLKVTSVSTNISFSFPPNIFRKRKLTFKNARKQSSPNLRNYLHKTCIQM